MCDVDRQSKTKHATVASTSTFEEEDDHGQKEEHEFAVLQNTLKYLRVHKIWPPPGEAFNVDSASVRKRVAPPLLILLTTLPFSVLLVGMVFHILIDKLDLSLGKALGNVITIFGNYSVIIAFVAKSNRVAVLCKKLSDFKTFGKPPNFDKTNLMLNRISLMYRVYIVSASTASVFWGIFDTSECETMNREMGLNEVCGLYAAIYVPFRTNSLTRPLVIGYQMYAVLVVVGGGTPLVFCTVEIATQIVLRIRHLNAMLEAMFDVTALNEMRLRQCIKYHQFIIGLVKDFNACYSIILGIHVMMFGVLLGSLGSVVLQKHDVCDTLYLGGWLVLLIIECYAGQIVSSSSDTLPIAAFNSSWYTAAVKDQKTFIFLLAMTQRTLYVNAAPLAFMSFPLMVQLLKASYSYLTLLLRD